MQGVPPWVRRKAGTPDRTGMTLVETLVVLTMVAIVFAVSLPRIQHTLDRLSVRSAAVDLTTTLHSARAWALANGAAVAVELDGATGTIRVRRAGSIVLIRNIGEAHGVQLRHSRDSIAFGHNGLGHGAANVSIVVSRRSAAETVFVSRLGRIR